MNTDDVVTVLLTRAQAELAAACCFEYILPLTQQVEAAQAATLLDYAAQASDLAKNVAIACNVLARAARQ